MASRPLLVTTSEGSLATEDDNNGNDGGASSASWHLDRYPPLFLLQTAGPEM